MYLIEAVKTNPPTPSAGPPAGTQQSCPRGPRTHARPVPLPGASDGAAALIGPDGQTLGLPMEAYRALIDIVRAMSQGRAITVAPVAQLPTTQKAADFLGISRPTLIKLLESGQIPFERPTASRHRRVQLADVIEHRHQSARDHSDALDAIAREAAEAGLYEDSAADYTAALRQARKN